MNAAEKRIRRLLFILPYVYRRREGVSVATLADMLSVSEVRLRQDVDAIRFAGVPGGEAFEQLNLEIRKVKTRAAGGVEERLFVHVAGPLSGPPRLTAQEAYALLLGASSLRGQGHTHLDAALMRAERKLRRLVRQGLPDFARESRIWIAGNDVNETLKKLAYAQEKKLTLDLDYASLKSGERQKIRFEPYGLINNAGFWYLVGRSLKHDAIRLLKVERVAAARLVPRRFVLPDNFDVRTAVGTDGLVANQTQSTIKLRLCGSAVPLSRGFEKSKKLASGEVEVRFTGHPSAALVSWILRHAPNVVVQGPPALARAVSQAAQAVLAIHDA